MTDEPPPAASSGTVLLDIGGEVGALVVYTDGGWLGREIEARPVGHHARPAHAAVLERAGAGGPLHAVVIPALPAGRYELWLDGAVRVGAAEVRPGGVTEAAATLP